jgi:L-ascorbate metabolism protein UlaG (beta-lactamase superfamily)
MGVSSWVTRVTGTLIGVVILVVLALLVATADVHRFDAIVVKPGMPGPGAVTLTWLGNTNVLVTDGTTAILTDGWFTRPSTLRILFGRIEPDAEAIEGALKRAGITHLAAVVTVHSHFDHAMDAPIVARRTGAVLLGSASTANIGRGTGLPEEQIQVATPGRGYEFGAFRVTMIESRHFVFPNAVANVATTKEIRKPLVPPARATEYAEGGSYSVLIQHPRGSLLVQGSAGFLPRSLAGIDVDAIVLGVGGIAGQTPAYQRDYWTHVVDVVQPEAIYPVHWDSFTADLADTATPPNLFWDQVFGLHAEASIAYALERGGDRVHLLPLWQPVPL